MQQLFVFFVHHAQCFFFLGFKFLWRHILNFVISNFLCSRISYFMLYIHLFVFIRKIAKRKKRVPLTKLWSPHCCIFFYCQEICSMATPIRRSPLLKAAIELLVIMFKLFSLFLQIDVILYLVITCNNA